MHECDLAEWVNQEGSLLERPFREAVHTILLAISNSSNLNTRMIMKGAVLLAIRYDGNRYTTDIDFSTSQKALGFDKEAFAAELGQALISATEKLDYGLSCKVQSCKLKPPDETATFPTLKITIGYAYKDDIKNHKRLLMNRSLHVVQIDYSFNEITNEVEQIQLKRGGTVLAYSFSDLIAEKYRAILQQPVRKRFRRQDVYDLYLLMERCNALPDKEREKILKSLIIKSASRGIDVLKTAMSAPQVKRYSETDYESLLSEIEGDLPEFDDVYTAVSDFYQNLPWERASLYK